MKDFALKTRDGLQHVKAILAAEPSRLCPILLPCSRLHHAQSEISGGHLEVERSGVGGFGNLGQNIR